MQKKILIAVDGSIHTKYALKYAASMFVPEAKVKFTLFNVQPFVSRYLVDEARKDPTIYAQLHAVNQLNADRSLELLETNKARLVRFGVAEKKIAVVSWPRALGQAKDILEYARRHRFDAVVIGRRGLSKAQKIFMGSTSAKILEHAESMPLWIVDGDVQSSNILAAVDISDSSSRIVDYLAMILGQNPDARITFFHVYEDPGVLISLDGSGLNAELSDRITQFQKSWIEQFQATVRERFEVAGIDNSQVKWVTLARNQRIAKMITEYAKANQFGTVVLGRRGSDDAFFTGRTAHYVAERLTACTLWIIG